MKIIKKWFENVDYILEDDEGNYIALWQTDWNGELYTQGYYTDYNSIFGQSNYLTYNNAKKHETGKRYKPILKEGIQEDEYIVIDFEEMY